jgi:hypothetical protein
MSDLLTPGDIQMQSNTPVESPSSTNSDNSLLETSTFPERLIYRLDAAVAGESLHDVMLAMASVIGRRFGKTHFGLVSHVLSSMVSIVRLNDQESSLKPKVRRKK